MSGPEDTGSHTVEDAARFERWRAGNYDPPEDDDEIGDGPPQPRYVGGYRAPNRCTCHSASEAPCDYCSGGP